MGKIVIATIRTPVHPKILLQLRTAYPEKTLEFVEIEPQDPQETVDAVKKSGAELVLLRPNPLPQLGLEQGIRFVLPSDEGDLVELKRVDAVTKPFRPSFSWPTGHHMPTHPESDPVE